MVFRSGASTMSVNNVYLVSLSVLLFFLVFDKVPCASFVNLLHTRVVCL